MTKPANESETKQFKRLVRQFPGGVDGILADKGFASQDNRRYLKRKKLTTDPLTEKLILQPN